VIQAWIRQGAMTREPEIWIDTPAFNWTPEVPLHVEPRFEDALTAELKNPKPRIEIPVHVTEQPAPSITRASTRETDGALAAKIQTAQPKVKQTGRVVEQRATSITHANAIREQVPRTELVTSLEVRAIALLLPRLLVGFAQSVSLSLLFAGRAAMDPYLFSAALMVGLFAPLLVLSGLGRARFALLLIWTIFAGLLLAAAGAYHHWRTLETYNGHPGLSLVALIALFLFIGQALVESRSGDYPAHYRSAWQLAIRIGVCSAAAGLAWAAAGAVSDLMREHYPALPFAFLIISTVTLSTALTAQLTNDWLLGVLQEGAVSAFAMALPFVLLLSVAVVGCDLSDIWQPSLPVWAALTTVLIVCINASYRDGTSLRANWRRRAEFAGSLVLLALVLMAAYGLAARVAQLGWTDGRIFAVAGLLMMGAYSLAYSASALISLGGGGWMQRIEDSNLALAFSALMLLAALASPLADPARLAVAAQTYRLSQHQVPANDFDYAWLRDHGLRFGHEALSKLQSSQADPLVARGAFDALTATTASFRPAPTEIGANIHVRSNQGLPSGLLERDWSKVSGAPPCLTNASAICDAFFADVDDDGRDEIILAYGTDVHWWASVMKQGQDVQGNMRGGWYVEGTLAPPSCPGSLTALRSGQFALVRPAGNWRDLLVAGMRLSVVRPNMPMACPLG